MDVQAGSVTVHKAGSQRRLPGGAAGSMSGGGSPLTSGASTPLARGPLAGPGVAEVQGEMLGLLDVSQGVAGGAEEGDTWEVGCPREACLSSCLPGVPAVACLPADWADATASGRLDVAKACRSQLAN
jgi:hypothetical protein